MVRAQIGGQLSPGLQRLGPRLQGAPHSYVFLLVPIVEPIRGEKFTEPRSFYIMARTKKSGVRRKQERHTETAGSGCQSSISSDRGTESMQQQEEVRTVVLFLVRI